MTTAGDNYIIELEDAHLKWGTFRKTHSRNPIEGEAYLPIPVSFSKEHDIVNTNATAKRDILGQNIFNFHTNDGFLEGTLKAQGCERAGELYAKQFSVKSNLKTLGEWYEHIHAVPGTRILVEWTSSRDVTLSVY